MMNDCAVEWIRECLPDYLHGTLNQRERLLVQAHLALCEECSSELALLEMCRTTMVVAPAIDVSRVVAMLPPPPALQRGVRTPTATETIPIRPSADDGWRRSGRATGWRIAAAALLMVGTVGVLVTRGGHWPAAEAVRAPGTYVASSNSRATDTVSGVGDSAFLAGQTSSGMAGGRPLFSLSGGLSDLSDDALNALLQEVDAVESLPLIDPPSMGAFSVTEQTGAE